LFSFSSSFSFPLFFFSPTPRGSVTADSLRVRCLA
jgi:hypothetical protein